MDLFSLSLNIFLKPQSENIFRGTLMREGTLSQRGRAKYFTLAAGGGGGGEGRRALFGIIAVSESEGFHSINFKIYCQFMID